jgi:hypothetical protein
LCLPLLSPNFHNICKEKQCQTHLKQLAVAHTKRPGEK